MENFLNEIRGHIYTVAEVVIVIFAASTICAFLTFLMCEMIKSI